MRFAWLLCFVLVLCAPALVGAHEVYVLTPERIASDMAAPSQNPFDAFGDNVGTFFFSAFVGFVFVSTVFFASITHRFEVFFAPYFAKMRPWAPVVARVTLGLSLIASGYNIALFGPELPLSDWGWLQTAAQWALYGSGALLSLGVFSRTAAAAATAVFVGGLALYGVYMLNYVNYLGEMLVVLMLGGGWAAAKHGNKEMLAFLLLRIGFGVAIIFAAIYGKFIYSNLALSTIEEYHLSLFFPFDPLFTVLGAFLVEILIGFFFIIGFEVRHTALFFLFWIFLSLLYFGEAVWPHLILIGINLALIMYGYDKWTVHGRLFNKGQLQPFL